MDHATRRARLATRLEPLGVDALLVSRLPNVRYLTGFTGSNGQVIVAPDRAVLFTDGRYIEQSAREVPDLERTVYLTGFVDPFTRTCRDLGLRRVGFEADGLTYRGYQDLVATPVELVPAPDEVERLRWVKDQEELALIQEAQAVTDDALGAVAGRLQEGITEREAAFDLDAFLRRHGDGVAFDTIVAFGESAAEPHHRPTDRRLGRGDVVKIDFGGLVGGYHADMTRTLCLGRPSQRVCEIFDVVRAAQQAGVDAVRAGVTGGHVDGVVRDLITGAGYGEAFTHGLGHGVGLEIHEGPSLGRQSEDILPAGAVVTVEPGIYLAGEGGVRIEDMVAVTGDGCRVLPRSRKDLVVL
jgi:Xaa-Pro dipeptidase